MKLGKIIWLVVVVNLLYAGAIDMNINTSWNKIFSYWKSSKFKFPPSCKGATYDEIDVLRKGLKLNLPDDFIKSLMICNGDKLDKKFFENKTDSLGVINLLDTKEILEIPPFDNPIPLEWVTIAYWDGDFQIILDTRQETFGQILFAVYEEDLFLVWANSFEEWLKLMVEEVIKYGNIEEDMLYNIYKSHTYKNEKMKKLIAPNY